jgi:hypothetical protein
MNDISTKQNTPDRIKMLAAQRQLYSQAKRINALQIILSVPCVVVWTASALIWPELKAGAAAWGIAIALMDLFFFVPGEKALKREAAKIQEYFDSEVLGLSWNKFKLGSYPDPELIAQASSAYFSRHDSRKLQDWYAPIVGEIPLSYARLICQRINCWWDMGLRKRYAKALISMLVALVLVVWGVSIYRLVSLEHFILIGIVPLVPAFLILIRLSQSHLEAVKKLDTLKAHIDSLWTSLRNETVSDERLLTLSQDLQAAIYDNRCSNPLVFNWVYNWLRDNTEDAMNDGAEKLVEQYRELHP